MYLSEIHIDGLKLLHEFSLDLRRDGQPRMWTVLVGRNGLCKTSILRAIALAASGRDLANELSSEQRRSFPDVRNEQVETQVRGVFEFGEVGAKLQRSFPEWRGAGNPHALEAEILLGPGARSFVGSSHYLPMSHQAELDPLTAARMSSTPHWFVAGYGVQRMLRTEATKSPDDFVRVRLATLFDSGALVSTDFADHLAKRFGETEARGYADVLHRAMLAHQDLLPRITAFELRGKGGVSTSDRLINSYRFGVQTGLEVLRLPATWLSHGYQAILAWLADLVGHVIWEARVDGRTGPILPSEMEGLVLVDELDLHLHPAWQVGLVGALKRTFPRLQFIVTTHSPMLLSSLEPDEIVVLEQDEVTGNVRKFTDPRTPKLQTSGELLERYFGVDELHPTRLLVQFQRFGFLANNPFRSDEEDREMLDLLAILRAEGVAPEWSPVSRRSR